LFSSFRRVTPRVPFWQLAAHRIPTLWSLYRGLLKTAESDEIRRQVGIKFRQYRSLTSPAQTKEQLLKAERLLKLCNQAQGGDARSKAFVNRYSRLLAGRRENERWERAGDNALREIERLRKRPIITGYFRPTLYHRALPRLKPQPAHISMMIRKRRKTRETRLEVYAELKDWTDDVKREAGIEKMLARLQGSEGDEKLKQRKINSLLKMLTEEEYPTLPSWISPISEYQQTIRTSLSADLDRLQSTFPPALVKTIEAARRERELNKRRESRRERAGEVLKKTLKRASKGPPAHVLCRMSEEQKRLDRIARSGVSEAGYVGYAKMRRGWKLKRNPWEMEDGPSKVQARLDEAEKEIMEENRRRRELWKNEGDTSNVDVDAVEGRS
ncbi:hypothetical protein BDY19DRAFT_901318, partial [Irpex rosettiformis]